MSSEAIFTKSRFDEEDNARGFSPAALHRKFLMYLGVPAAFAVYFVLCQWAMDQGWGLFVTISAFYLFMIPICMYFEKFIPFYHQTFTKEEIVDDITAFLFERTATTGMRAGLFALTIYLFTLIGPPPITLLEHLPVWLAYIVFFLVADFGAYWEHRLLHTNRFLWKGHITHHIVNKNYFLNEYHRHPFGYLLYLPFAIIPLWLLGADETFFLHLALFIVFCNYFQHLNADLRLGPLNYIFSFSPVHKFHHSTDRSHADGNFGHNLIIYDILFGTYIDPKKHSYPVEMGLYSEVPGYPKIGFFRQILAPFNNKYWRKKKKG